MKWQLWKVYFGRRSKYFLVNNVDGWIYFRNCNGWYQTWCQFYKDSEGITLIANNYKESK